MDDTAEYTSYAAPDSTAPRFLRIAGNQVSPKEIKGVVSEVTGEKFRLFRAGLWQEEMKKYRAEQVLEAEKKKIIQSEIQRKETERENFKELLKQAKRWHKANILRDYINKFEISSLENNTLTEDVNAWLSRAKGKADWYDPFINQKDDFLADEDLQIL